MQLLKYMQLNAIFFSDIKQRLQKNSVLWNRLLTTVETEVLDMFEQKSFIDTTKTQPKQPEDVELTNMLISEYMDWMGYKMTNTIFTKGTLQQYFSLLKFVELFTILQLFHM